MRSVLRLGLLSGGSLLMALACSVANAPEDPLPFGNGGTAATGTGGGGGGGATGGGGGGGGGSTGCESGKVDCGGECVDGQSDPLHCGASGDCSGDNAGVACVADVEECAGGKCQCLAGLLVCEEQCTDPQTDAKHCGATGDCTGTNTGVECPMGSSCIGGQCLCDAALVLCEGKCIDPKTDNVHCGAIGSCTGPAAGVNCPPQHPCAMAVCGTPVNPAVLPKTIGGTTVGVTDLARDDNGDVLFVDVAKRTLFRMNHGTGAVTVIASSIGGTMGMLLGGVAYRPTDGLVYLSDDAKRIHSLDPKSPAPKVVVTLKAGGNTVAVAPPNFGAHGGKVFVGLDNGNIDMFDPKSPAVTNFAVAGTNVSDIVFAGNATLYAVTSAGVVSITATGKMATLATKSGLDGIEIDEVGNRLFLADSNSDVLLMMPLPNGVMKGIASVDFDDGWFVSGLSYDGSKTLLMATGEQKLTIMGQPVN